MDAAALGKLRLNRLGGEVSRHKGGTGRPSRGAEVKGLLETFSFVWVSGHQRHFWERERTDAKEVTDGESVGLVMGQTWGEGKAGPLTETENRGGEAG